MQVGSAQKWYDELDNLVFSTPESELADEDEDTASAIKFQDDKVHISTAVNTSPGTSEVCNFIFLLLLSCRHFFYFGRYKLSGVALVFLHLFSCRLL